MAFTFISSVGNDATASAGTIATAAGVVQVAGNLVCVWVGYDGAATTVSVADGDGTYAEVGSEITNSNYRVRMFWKIVGTNGTRTITATFGANRGFRGIATHVSSGARTPTPLDVQNAQAQTAPGTGANGVTTGTATNTFQPAQIIGLGFSYNGFQINAGTSMTSRNNSLWANITGAANATMVADRAVTSLAAWAATWTATNNSLHFAKMGIFLEPEAGTTITPPVGALAFSGAAPSVIREDTIAPTVGALAISGSVPTVDSGAGVQITPTVGALVLSGIAPVVTRQDSIAPTVGALTINGLAPSVVSVQTITPSVGALTLTGAVVTQTLTLPAPTPGAMVFSGIAPTLIQGRVITPTVGALTIAGVAPTVHARISPTTGALVISGITPNVTVTAAGTIQPQPGALTLSGVAPSLTRADSIAPNVGATVLAGVAPSVTQQIYLQPTTFGALLASSAPQIVVTGHVTVQAVVGALVMQGYAPAIIHTGQTDVRESFIADADEWLFEAPTDDTSFTA